MAFQYDLEKLASLYDSRKDTIKKKLKAIGFKENKDYIIRRDVKESWGGHNKQTIMLTKTCYDQLCLHLSISKRYAIKEETKVQYIKRYLPAETEIIDFIYESLSPMYDMKKQYKVGNYRIDLYIKTKNIAIECDENNHADYDKEKEATREQYIKDKLSCRFIRFDPYDKTFKLSSLISWILCSI